MIIAMALFLAVGELASGTGIFYVAMMTAAVIAICVTYNMLGGLGTIGGIAFTYFAVYTLLFAQFAKVIFFQPADRTLQSPELTIAVYATYFVALMAGVFLFGWIRVDLPRPVEPETSAHLAMMYAVCFVAGTLATIYMTNLVLEHPDQATSTGHGFLRALSLLLPLSLVLAVDRRIRKTGGKRCFGWAAFWPSLVIEFMGWTVTGRREYVEPVLLVFITCYFRGFKLEKRHFIVAGAMAAALFLFVSPWYLYARPFRKATSLWERIQTMSRLLVAVRQNWPQAEALAKVAVAKSAAQESAYFTGAGDLLNRLVLIETDSGVISACSHYHWGLATISLDLQDNIPHFIEPNKPDVDATWFRASVAREQSSQQESHFVTTSIISDAWGAFGWLGVIGVPLVLVPWLFVLYDSIFDMTRPWGTVAVMALLFQVGAGGVGKLLFSLMIVMPLSMLLISWFTGWIVRYIPLSGDAPLRRRGPLFEPEKAVGIAGE